MIAIVQNRVLFTFMSFNAMFFGSRCEKPCNHAHVRRLLPHLWRFVNFFYELTALLDVVNNSFFSYACVSFSIFFPTFLRVEVTQLYAAIIKPRGTLWSAPLEVSMLPGFLLSPQLTFYSERQGKTRTILLHKTLPRSDCIHGLSFDHF